MNKKVKSSVHIHRSPDKEEMSNVNVVRKHDLPESDKSHELERDFKVTAPTSRYGMAGVHRTDQETL